MRKLKTFFVKTYGCQMNELDSDIMVGQLENRGLTRTNDESIADLLIFNTCSIRDLAERKVMGKLGKLGRNGAHHALIGVTGCMANAKKDALFQKLPTSLADPLCLKTFSLQDQVQLLNRTLKTKP